MKQIEYIYPGALQKISKVLSESNSTNILLIRGKESFIKSGAQDLLSSVFRKYNVFEFSEFSNNPKIEEAREGYKIFKKKNIDVILAVGGGSVIDTAKIIKYLAINESEINNYVQLIAIPTTAGTGSEATHFAVVYINGIKHSLSDNGLLPNVAIVDSNLIKGQSKYQMVVSGLDAFAQGIESFWSVNSTQESMDYSARAIKLIWENLENAINGDVYAKEMISIGSNLAGKAINIAKTTAPHAISYAFTSYIGLPHGHAVSLTLPFFVKLHLNVTRDNCNDIRGASHLIYILSEISKVLSIELDELQSAILFFYRRLSISIDFNEIGITKEIYQKVILQINEERLQNNPVKVDSNTLKQLYESNTNFVF